jgi:hypothetical protein
VSVAGDELGENSSVVSPTERSKLPSKVQTVGRIQLK